MLESARKLLEIFNARLGLARIFLENELLENARLEFYFPCSKSPNTDESCGEDERPLSCPRGFEPRLTHSLDNSGSFFYLDLYYGSVYIL